MYTTEEPCTVTVSMDAAGQPYRIRCWENRVERMAGTIRDGRTEVTLTLMPGEAAMVALEKHTPGEMQQDGIPAQEAGQKEMSGKSGEITVMQTIPLEDWTLTVEDWNAGEKQVITEDRGLGLITNEVYYETKKTQIDVGAVSLVPWRELLAVGPEVSGVGRYTTKICLPDPKQGNKALLKIGGTYGNTAAVYVNGEKADGFDINRKAADISRLLHVGENEICIEVSSTLKNRLIARGYYKPLEEMFRMHEEQECPDTGESGPAIPAIDVADYGLEGPVVLKLYEESR